MCWKMFSETILRVHANWKDNFVEVVLDTNISKTLQFSLTKFQVCKVLKYFVLSLCDSKSSRPSMNCL